MVALETPLCDFDRKAIDFCLPGVDGKTWTLAECSGPRGVLVMFLCNHCPYVQMVVDRLICDVKELQTSYGIGAVAIMANDVEEYPQDSFDNMKKFATQRGFCFPYLYDATQETAQRYEAVCTPDFFGFNADNKLQYRGRLDGARQQMTSNARRELFEAMMMVSKIGRGPQEQYPSIGCSIKWRNTMT
ncbi:Thioredoxin family protein [Azospirillaceae bacterium]